jgi:SAM-dependent methyltransferase
MVDRRLSTPGHVDTRYYEAVAPGSIGERVLVAARNRIWRDFIARCRPKASDTLLDVGVSDVINAGANLVERLYPHPEQVTACGLGSGDDFRQAFPAVNYVQIEPHAPLPFADDQFAIATSNAVLEHVGSEAEQARHVRELFRVAPRIFITVPHRYFPIEHHTSLPFLHWADASFRLACRVSGKAKWASREELILMTRRRLRSLVPAHADYELGYTGLKLGPLSSNLFLFLRR